MVGHIAPAVRPYDFDASGGKLFGRLKQIFRVKICS
jgi:hypothetical protein